ncbi:MAG TPA: zinc ABC transporter substrate-binding protein, partial [Cyclobacteriaceae bacterium]|nr:zinc ABC transporter substrate-binding protein [Cyclobacteriaceae bacterium]
IVARKINAVFVETSVPEKAIKAVVEGCKKKGHPLQIGGYLYSDALGTAGTPEGTYIGMFKANVKTIVESLKTEDEPTL